MNRSTSELCNLLDGFDPDISVECATTPPSSWYTEPSMLEAEYRSVFRRRWLAVGNVQQVAQPGDYFTGCVGDEPYVVLRGKDRVLYAHYNVCQHHGACVMQGEGRAERLTCPYHGWSYDLDGRLLKAPKLGAIKNFDRDAFHLRSMAVTVWGGLVFIYLGTGTPPDVQEEWKTLETRLAGFGQAGLVFETRRSYTLECNWKVFVDNYLDGGYHVNTIHPGLAQELAQKSYRTEAFETFSIQSSESSADAGLRIGSGALYAFVYPNLMINRYGPVMDINVVFPLGPQRCVVVFDYFFDRKALGAEAASFVERCLAQSDQIQQEDIGICASVQRGLRSSGYDVGRYAPQLEHAMHSFHRLLAYDLRTAL